MIQQTTIPVTFQSLQTISLKNDVQLKERTGVFIAATTAMSKKRFIFVSSDPSVPERAYSAGK